MYEKKKLNKSKRQKQPEENIINSIRNRFALKKTNKRKKKPKIIRLIRTLFEQEDDDYYKPEREVISGKIIILNMKVMVVEIKSCITKNT